MPPTEARLDLLVRDAAQRVAATTSAEIKVAAEPCEVVGDRERLHRAIINVIDNAVKRCPPGATVEVRLAGGEIRVRDHSPGVAEEQLARVFDLFYRAPEARPPPGSGPGLAIVRQVAEHHGGSVEAAAAPGGGALFTLRLPVAPEPAAHHDVLA